MPFEDPLDPTEKLTFSHEYVDVILRQSVQRELYPFPLSFNLQRLIDRIGAGEPDPEADG
ncbi:hypothetical protein [Microvirga pudoricolor]|uniref:hypothetical protein n=1 Tax=Microvirga pudoricolor TaxID=2778729 RepID=UPI0019523EEF|nr:hypothetical protein [Microvirga pudoricolor]MBM6593133.1 hypothetical protein [Microvirga pudoricolor]